jgi:hypothetical protein
LVKNSSSTIGASIVRAWHLLLFFDFSLKKIFLSVSLSFGVIAKLTAEERGASFFLFLKKTIGGFRDCRVFLPGFIQKLEDCNSIHHPFLRAVSSKALPNSSRSIFARHPRRCLPLRPWGNMIAKSVRITFSFILGLRKGKEFLFFLRPGALDFILSSIFC